MILSKRWMAALAGLFFLCGAAWAQSMMSDEQVLEYAQQGLAEGKSRDELVQELALRGVNRAQAERVFALYQSRQANNSNMPELREDSRSHVVNPLLDTTAYEPVAAPATPQVYGRNIFNNRNLNFAPSENLATPRNYKLGPGDEVIIDIFGRNQTTLRSTISPEGSINVDLLGPLYLNGMTVEEANTYLRKRLSRIYGGMSGSGTDMRLSLGQIRTIQVNVLGDVTNPGTYQLSAFATAFHALYRAGGIQDPGTVRNIKVVRGDKVAGLVDVYEFLLKGNSGSDIRLEEGDVILVSPYSCLVTVEGGVKRPMQFEMKTGETLANLIEYAGVNRLEKTHVIERGGKTTLFLPIGDSLFRQVSYRPYREYRNVLAIADLASRTYHNRFKGFAPIGQYSATAWVSDYERPLVGELGGVHQIAQLCLIVR